MAHSRSESEFDDFRKQLSGILKTHNFPENYDCVFLMYLLELDHNYHKDIQPQAVTAGPGKLIFASASTTGPNTHARLIFENPGKDTGNDFFLPARQALARRFPDSSIEETRSSTQIVLSIKILLPTLADFGHYLTQHPIFGYALKIFHENDLSAAFNKITQASRLGKVTSSSYAELIYLTAQQHMCAEVLETKDVQTESIQALKANRISFSINRAQPMSCILAIDERSHTVLKNYFNALLPDSSSDLTIERTNFPTEPSSVSGVQISLAALLHPQFLTNLKATVDSLSPQKIAYFRMCQGSYRANFLEQSADEENIRTIRGLFEKLFSRANLFHQQDLWPHVWPEIPFDSHDDAQEFDRAATTGYYQYLSKIAHIGPHASASVSMAVRAVQFEDYDDAIAELEDSVKLAAENYYALSKQYTGQAQTNADWCRVSLMWIDQALQLDPSNPNYLAQKRALVTLLPLTPFEAAHAHLEAQQKPVSQSAKNLARRFYTLVKRNLPSDISQVNDGDLEGHRLDVLINGANSAVQLDSCSEHLMARALAHDFAGEYDTALACLRILLIKSPITSATHNTWYDILTRHRNNRRHELVHQYLDLYLSFLNEVYKSRTKGGGCTDAASIHYYRAEFHVQTGDYLLALHDLACYLAVPGLDYTEISMAYLWRSHIHHTLGNQALAEQDVNSVKSLIPIQHHQRTLLFDKLDLGNLRKSRSTGALAQEHKASTPAKSSNRASAFAQVIKDIEHNAPLPPPESSVQLLKPLVDLMTPYSHGDYRTLCHLYGLKASISGNYSKAVLYFSANTVVDPPYPESMIMLKLILWLTGKEPQFVPTAFYNIASLLDPIKLNPDDYFSLSALSLSPEDFQQRITICLEAQQNHDQQHQQFWVELAQKNLQPNTPTLLGARNYFLAGLFKTAEATLKPELSRASAEPLSSVYANMAAVTKNLLELRGLLGRTDHTSISLQRAHEDMDNKAREQAIAEQQAFLYAAIAAAAKDWPEAKRRFLLCGRPDHTFSHIDIALQRVYETMGNTEAKSEQAILEKYYQFSGVSQDSTSDFNGHYALRALALEIARTPEQKEVAHGTQTKIGTHAKRFTSLTPTENDICAWLHVLSAAPVWMKSALNQDEHLDALTKALAKHSPKINEMIIEGFCRPNTLLGALLIPHTTSTFFKTESQNKIEQLRSELIRNGTAQITFIKILRAPENGIAVTISDTSLITAVKLLALCSNEQRGSIESQYKSGLITRLMEHTTITVELNSETLQPYSSSILALIHPLAADDAALRSTQIRAMLDIATRTTLFGCIFSDKQQETIQASLVTLCKTSNEQATIALSKMSVHAKATLEQDPTAAGKKLEPYIKAYLNSLLKQPTLSSSKPSP